MCGCFENVYKCINNSVKVTVQCDVFFFNSLSLSHVMTLSEENDFASHLRLIFGAYCLLNFITFIKLKNLLLS